MARSFVTTGVPSSRRRRPWCAGTAAMRLRRRLTQCGRSARPWTAESAALRCHAQTLARNPDPDPDPALARRVQRANSVGRRSSRPHRQIRKRQRCGPRIAACPRAPAESVDLLAAAAGCLAHARCRPCRAPLAIAATAATATVALKCALLLSSVHLRSIEPSCNTHLLPRRRSTRHGQRTGSWWCSTGASSRSCCRTGRACRCPSTSPESHTARRHRNRQSDPGGLIHGP